MEALIAQVIEWVKANPNWSLIAVFVISVSESLAVIGLVVPGVLMMGSMGALIAAGAIGFWPVVAAAVLGAIVGDGLSFWLGHYFKDDIRRAELLAKKGIRFMDVGVSGGIWGLKVG